MAGQCFAAPALIEIDLLVVSPENGGRGIPSVSMAKGVKGVVAIGLGVTPMGPGPSGAASMVCGTGILFADASANGFSLMVPDDRKSPGWTESVPNRPSVAYLGVTLDGWAGSVIRTVDEGQPAPKAGAPSWIVETDLC